LGRKKPNPFGIYDMHGNVWEWVEDHWQGNHEGASTDGSAWLTGDDHARRVLRGGSWNNNNNLRSANRNNNNGFRVVVGAQTQHCQNCRQGWWRACCLIPVRIPVKQVTASEDQAGPDRLVAVRRRSVRVTLEEGKGEYEVFPSPR
jgi:hypothetical protein